MGCFCAKIYVMLKQLREICNYFNIATENTAAVVEKSTNKASEESVQAPLGLLCAGSRPAEAEVAQAGLRSRRRRCCRRHARIRARAHAHE